ncbi:rRNA-processing protein EBP2 [Babesia bovis T2Bo]|uniref:rRNA processing protein n=1 Tax=Babesia bovis TaxID=5865 RepID=A7AWD4_BABBO|nr:rRNA-processing protein EBP2 [Babesia bovis T2Bo]EDO05362.1 rRNA-processing protein EBP2 [Babesia bovis T2Bo]|eukprot:XP_001608930.1 hypothetical protein [Babesia bovis T2Bo]
MPLQIKALGYVLQPGERFIDSDDIEDYDDDDEITEETSSQKRIHINKTEEIIAKIKEIIPKRNGKELPWIETLALTSDEPCSKEFNHNETLKVEQHFKDIAMSCVKDGLQRLVNLGIDFNRPSDFYADMIKTDFQMERVMAKLANRTKRIQEKRNELNMKVKKGFDKQVKQRQRKNQFIKEVEDIVKNRKDDVPVERQIDRLIENNSNSSSGKKSDNKIQKSGKKKVLGANSRGSKKPASGRKGGKTKKNDTKKSSGKSSRRTKGQSRPKGATKKKGKGRK